MYAYDGSDDTDPRTIKTILRRLQAFVQKYRKQCIIVLTPLILLPLPLASSSQKTLCGYTLLIMAVYWCTEVVPLAITALMPVFLLPAFGIMKTREVCDSYIKETNVVIIGGCMIALAIENTNLHKRVAVKILRSVGSKQGRLMFGFQLTSWLLSMCITNTATVATMLPILDAVLSQIGADDRRSSNDLVQSSREVRQEEIRELQASLDALDSRRHGHRNLAASVATIETYVDLNSHDRDKVKEMRAFVDDLDSRRAARSMRPISTISTTSSHRRLIDREESAESFPSAWNDDDEKKKFKSFSLAMILSVVYAANIGGIGTLTGTGPNLVVKQSIDDWWNDRGLGESTLTFASWMLVGFPIAVINLGILWLWMQIFYIGPKSILRCYTKDEPDDDTEREARITAVINKERDSLGDICFAEVVVGTLFIMLILLWFFRSPGFIPGWAGYLDSGYLGPATPAMFIVLILFIVPKTLPGADNGRGGMDMILNWPMVQQKLPWGVVFLMGGGFAMAEGSRRTGLSDWIGSQLGFVRVLPGFVMIFVLCLLVGLLTEITSNVAVCTMLMPIMASLAVEMNQNPLYLMLPVGIATSFAFMLPVATPPNALGFEYGQMKILDMVKPGAVLNVLCIIPVAFVTETWANAYFHFNEIPTGSPQNATLLSGV